MSFTRSERSHTFDVTSTGGHWFVYALTPDYEITNYEGDVSKTVTVSLKSGATPAASTTLYIGKPNGKADQVTLLFEDIGEEPEPEPEPEPAPGPV
jgi:hypothetical protein